MEVRLKGATTGNKNNNTNQVQCDQMAFIDFILCPFTTTKNCPIVYKIYQSQEQFLPNTK